MLSSEIQELVDRNVSGTDILHGYLKNALYEADLELAPLQENSEELGSDEDYSDTVDRLNAEGFMDALVMVNDFVIDLTYALEARVRG
jgi:hypothetical protein